MAIIIHFALNIRMKQPKWCGWECQACRKKDFPYLSLQTGRTRRPSFLPANEISLGMVELFFSNSVYALPPYWRCCVPDQYFSPGKKIDMPLFRLVSLKPSTPLMETLSILHLLNSFSCSSVGICQFPPHFLCATSYSVPQMEAPSLWQSERWPSQ